MEENLIQATCVCFSTSGTEA